MRKNKRTPWTDETILEWGKHKGEALKDIPHSYFLWLAEQPWLPQWPQLATYIDQNRSRFKAEAKDEDEDNEAQGYSSYQDFLDDR